MSDTPTDKKKRMSITAFFSSLFLVVMVVWAFASFALIQGDLVYPYDKAPHEELDDVEPWDLDLNWAGGRTNWFDNINYTDLPLDQELPLDLLNFSDNVLFIAEPSQPPQLWRSSSYDNYDGSGWHKTLPNSQTDVTLIDRSVAESWGNTIFTVYMNVSAGASVNQLELPTLFPGINVISDSFRSYPSGLLRSYTLQTDPYGTLLFGPLIEGTSDEMVLISYDLTFQNQDLAAIQSNAQRGSVAHPEIAIPYTDLSDVTLSPEVLADIARFDNPTASAYEIALAVDLYFRTNFQVILNLTDRPASGEEVTHWFLQRGGGLPMDFATAYSVYMRQLDIPARMVTGYAIGEEDNGRRIIMVRHMMFWVEVFIPAGTFSEWIQVVPLGLPESEDPSNTNQGDVQVLVGKSDLIPWELTGVSFNVSSMILVEGIPLNSPEIIQFWDITDNMDIGSAVIQMGTFYPLANITYQFPLDATVGPHIISATWQTSSFTVTNFTVVNAVAQANPMQPLPPSSAPAFELSGIVDLDLRLGLDNYTAYWQDTVLVSGVMMVGGNPVNGNDLTNRWVQIMWGGEFVGNATIGPDGYYELPVIVNPALPWMSLGQHEVWAVYAGEYDEYGFPLITPGESADRSTVEVWGTVGFTFTVSPNPTYGGTILTYSGTATLLNGTPLDTETISIYFNGTLVNSATTDSFGNFVSTYTPAADYPAGTYNASVSWISTMPLVTGNSSSILVTILSGATNITIDSNPAFPQVVHIQENITIWGWLTIQANGSGLVDQTVDIYWYNGTSPAMKIGSVNTTAGGYYEFNYTVPAGYEGSVTYWAEFPGDPVWNPSNSGNMTITVKKWDVIVSIDVDVNPVHPLQNVTITGNVTFPERGGELLRGVTVDIYWWGVNIGPVTTSIIDGQYVLEYPVPYDHEFALFPIYAEFVSPSPAFASNQSQSLMLNVTPYEAIIDLYSNSTYYHLNETAYIWGQLKLDNGTPLAGVTVYIEWNNGTIPVPTTSVITNATGWFNYTYVFSTGKDSDVTVTVTANYTSLDRLITNTTSAIMIYVQLYQLTLSSTDPPDAHLDEVIVFTGTLIFDEGSVPAVGETIAVHYRNSTHHLISFKTTNNTGGFYFQYNLTMNDMLGAVYLWASYSSSNPLLWENAQSSNRSVSLIKYLFDLTLFTNGTSFHLDEVVHVWGNLIYHDNSTPLADQTIWVSWSNGSIYEYGPYYTDATGLFDFYYNFSLGKDSSGPIDIWAKFNTTNQMWNNTRSVTQPISVDRYDFTLTASAVGGLTHYLDEVIHIWGILTFTTNGTPIDNWPIRIYWRWDNGTEVYFDGPRTNSSGHYDFYYNVSLPKDREGTATIWAAFTNTNPMWDNANSSDVAISLEKYVSIFTVIPSPNNLYLNETITFTAMLVFSHNMSAIRNASVTIWWDYLNGTTVPIDTRYTNSTGHIEFTYSGMDNDVILSIEVYGTYAGNDTILADSSVGQSVTLSRWATDITSFNIGGVFSYEILDTITFTGTLNYMIPGPYPFGNASVRFLLDSTEIAVNFTRSDGSFIYRWQIPEGTAPGSYTVSVSYMSGVNWIENYSTPTIGINIAAVLLDWSVFDVDPDIVYLDGSLNISGVLRLGNGSAFAFAPVEIFWDHDVSSIFSTFTDANGYYEYIFRLDATTPLGFVDFWVSCTPTQTYIVGSSSGTSATDIRRVPVDLNTIGTYSTPVYRGNTVTVQGNLTFGVNGSAMVGYTVELIWDGISVDSTIVVDASQGAFTLSYVVDWTETLGPVEFYVQFARPSDVFDTAESDPHFNEDVWDSVMLSLDDSPVSVVVRGEDWIWVSGTVDNGNGPVGNVPLSVTIDGFEETTGSSGTDGTFQIRLDIPGFYTGGSHVISVDVPPGNFYNLSGPPDSWSIEFHIATALSITFIQRTDAMPGEDFSAQFQLIDDQGGQLYPSSLSFYLNGTWIDTLSVTTAGPITWTFTIPASVTERGDYILELIYGGAGYYEASQAETTDLIHIFTDIYLLDTTPRTILPGEELTLTGQLLDAPVAENGQPIVGRALTISLNGTRTVSLVTGTSGEYRYTGLPVYNEEGHFDYRVSVGDTDFGLVTVRITYGGIDMQLEQLVPLIALASAIVVVLLYLYFVKGMFHPTVSTTGVDIPAKLRNIKKLADAGKYSEAITLAYRTFEQMCGMKMGSERLPSETAREYLERVLKSLPLDAATIEEFVQTYEEARFSDHEISRERYELAIKIFTDIYPRIEGSKVITPVT